MDKRALIGIALSILVLVVYQQLVNYYYPTSRDGAGAGRREERWGESPRRHAPTITPAPATPAATAPIEIPSGQSAKEITVETDNYLAVFTTHGARLKSFKFKKYRTSAEPTSPLFEIVTAAPWSPVTLRRAIAGCHAS